MKKLFMIICFILFTAASASAQWDLTYDELTAPASGDLYLIQDVSDTGDTAQGTTKYIPHSSMIKPLYTDVDTTETALTAAQVTNSIVTNQGATGEVDVILPAISYYSVVRFIITEAQILEVNPPTDEIFDLDGTALDANDCVDSPAIVGSKMLATRMQLADASWRWSLDTIRGAWVDTGASD